MREIIATIFVWSFWLAVLLTFGGCAHLKTQVDSSGIDICLGIGWNEAVTTLGLKND